MSMENSVTAKASDAVSRIRLTLDISARLNEAVEKIAFAKGISKADVMRNAVEILVTANNAREDGMHVGAWSETRDGVRREREFVGL